MHQNLSTIDTTPQIRAAEASDLPEILTLVRELAEYENGLDKVTADLETYRDAFDAGYFEAIVAVINGEIVGTAIYYRTFSTWKGRMMYLEDFIVKEQYRRHGVGKLLFDTYILRAKEVKSALCKWQVLRWNELAINFYKKYDTVFDDEWVDVKMYL